MSTIHGFELACNGTRKRPSSKIVVVTPQAGMLPEAACSVTLCFEVPGYGKAQATGRGATADDAAANLTAMMAATRAALVPVVVEPPVRSLQARLGHLAVCWLAKAHAMGDMPLTERITKAVLFVLSDAVQPGEREGLMTVRSMQDGGLWYECENGQCTCRDWSAHTKAGAKHACKHILAVAMHLRLSEPQ